MPGPDDDFRLEPYAPPDDAEARAAAAARLRAAELSDRVLAAARASRTAVNAARWPELYALWASVIARALAKARDLPPESQALVVLAAISGASGADAERQRIRIPSPAVLRLALRDARIWAEFDGRNVEALRVKYGFRSIQSVYNILAAQRSKRPIRQPSRARRGRKRR